MSRSNYDKPFYVDVGTSIAAIRCASNSDVIFEYDYRRCPQVIQFAKDACDRINREAEIGRPLRNCDVGSAEEQYNRFVHCCTSRKIPCRRYDTFSCAKCYAVWSQMPYEEGGAK